MALAVGWPGIAATDFPLTQHPEAIMIVNMDTTRPNVSRVYDYMLGGHHNFEVDRAMGQQILQVFPSYPVWARLNRWFLQMVAQQWSTRGYEHILDLGSGMPTQDHFHAVASGARVLYCDNDAIAVAYAREVIGSTPRVRYIEHDVRDMGPILKAADEHFAGERYVAVGCIGVSYFFDEPTLTKMLRDIHAWAAPGSVLAISFLNTTASAEDQRVVLDTIARLGITAHPRTPEALAAIAAPWRVREVRPLSAWLGVENQIAPDDFIGNTVEMYGAIFDH